MNNNLRRIVALITLCAGAIPASASADDSTTAPAESITEFCRIDQSDKLAALTEEQMRAILGRLERDDAYKAATRRSVGQREVDYRGAHKLDFSPSRKYEKATRGVGMDVDTDEQKVILEWYVGF